MRSSPAALATQAALTLVLLLLGGCATTNKYSVVEQARLSLVGLHEEDVLMCAGFPEKRTGENGTEIWSYEEDIKAGNVAVSAPLLFGAAHTSMNYSSGGSCRVQFRFEQGKVIRVAFAGNNDTAMGRDTLCAPVVDDCVHYIEDTPLAKAAAKAVKRSEEAGADKG